MIAHEGTGRHLFNKRTPMKLLALETSTRMGSIALFSDGVLLAEYQTGIRATYSEMLLPLIDLVLRTADCTIEEMDMFAVARGPGSFTALRIGMSVMAGLSIATAKPIIPVPTLDGLAYNVYGSRHLICPLLDGRRGELYYAFYKWDDAGTLRRLSPYRVAAPGSVIAEISEPVILLGDGITLYADLFVNALQERAVIPPPHLHYPRASAIGALAMQRMSDDPGAAVLGSVAPLYLRSPDAGLK